MVSINLKVKLDDFRAQIWWAAYYVRKIIESTGEDLERYYEEQTNERNK